MFNKSCSVAACTAVPGNASVLFLNKSIKPLSSLMDAAQKCANCLTNSAQLFPVIIIIESEVFISSPLPDVFFFSFPSLLMPGLNGDSLGCTLGGFAEQAVVTIDKKEWGHGGRQCALIITLPASISWQKAFLQNKFFYLIMTEANRRASMS